MTSTDWGEQTRTCSMPEVVAEWGPWVIRAVGAYAEFSGVPATEVTLYGEKLRRPGQSIRDIGYLSWTGMVLR